MKFVDGLNDEQTKMLTAAIRELRDMEACVYLGDRLAEAFERKPRTREAWIHTRHLADSVLDGDQMTVYKHDPQLSGNCFIKVRITEVL